MKLEHLYQRLYKCYNAILASKTVKSKLEQMLHSKKMKLTVNHILKKIILF